MNQTSDRVRVSIVMSFYNEPLQWIRLAVESVLNQTYRDFEFIIVCDNPKHEDGLAYISSLDDNRIKLIINTVNIGPTKSFNKAIASSAGEYIARMDADDIGLPERLEKQVEYLDSHPQVSVCACNAHVIDKDGKITRRNRYSGKRDQALNMISNSIAHPTVMFRKCLLELRNPIYNEDYIYSQDYELWSFLILNGHKLHTLEEPLLLYRKSSGQISAAKKSAQSDLFKKAHENLVIGWLASRGIIDGDKDLKTILKKSLQAYPATEGEERRYLTYIIYVLYFSIGTLDWKYRLLFLADRHFIAFRINWIFTYRMLFSRQVRRKIAGINI